MAASFMKSVIHTLIDEKRIKNPFNRNNVATSKTNKILTKILLQSLVE